MSGEVPAGDAGREGEADATSGTSCLIVVTAARYSEAYLEAALASARRRGETVILCLVEDHATADAVAHRMADTSVLGEHLREELRHAIEHDEEDRGRRHLEAARKEAASRGVHVETRIEAGDLIEGTVRAVRATGARRVLVARSSGTRLTRVLAGSRVERLRRVSPVPVHAFDLGGGDEGSAESPPADRTGSTPSTGSGPGIGGTR